MDFEEEKDLDPEEVMEVDGGEDDVLGLGDEIEDPEKDAPDWDKEEEEEI